MRSPVTDQLSEIFLQCAELDDGSVADYIPELAGADPRRFGLCIASVEGRSYAFGDVDLPFTVQSIVKVFTYALALETHGADLVDARIDVEPSGEAFNVLSLDPETHRPRNAMINAGAIAAASLLPGRGVDEQLAVLLDYLARLVDHPVEVDERVWASEAATGHRNLAIAHLLKSVGMIDGDPTQVADLYFRACAIRVTARDLAALAAVLANGGVRPRTGEVAIAPDVVRRVLSVMSSCGMYDGAGHWMTAVGLPAKSGVSGGILAVLPQQFGAATYSPRLNANGNSVRGVAAFRALSERYGSHVFEPRVGRVHTVRADGDPGDRVGLVRLSVHGDLDPVGIEALLARLVEQPDSVDTVLVDLSLTDRITANGRHLLGRVGDQFAAAGRRLEFDDPQGLLLAPPVDRP